jgi:hypothetical protein
MDAQHFDRLTRSLATTTGRRGALRLLGGGALGAALAKLGLGRAAAQEAASRDEGDACTRSRQCRGALRCCNGRCGRTCRSWRGRTTTTRCREPADCPKGLVCVDEGCCDGKPRVCARPCGTRDTRFETASDDGPTRVPVEAEPAAAPGPETPD